MKQRRLLERERNRKVCSFVVFDGKYMKKQIFENIQNHVNI